MGNYERAILVAGATWRPRARRRTKATGVLLALITAALAILLPLPPDTPAYAAPAAPAAPAAGGKPGAQFSGGVTGGPRIPVGVKPGVAQPAITFSASCPPLSVDPDPRRYLISRVYYVSHWPAVNVRRGPGLGYCVIGTQSYTANVVAVPGVAMVYNNGYRWREVAFYLGRPRTANNYSWSAVGWIADSLLAPANHAIASSACSRRCSMSLLRSQGKQRGGECSPNKAQWS